MRYMIIYFLLFIAILNLPAQESMVVQNILPSGVIANGGNVLSDSSYRILGTLGQPIIGTVHNPNNEYKFGFWYNTHPLLESSIEQPVVIQPENFQLKQNYPNPFNPSTIISWQLPVAGHVELIIYNILGEKVVSLVSEKQKAGFHKIEFNGQNLASGVYLYRIQSTQYHDVKKMVLLR